MNFRHWISLLAALYLTVCPVMAPAAPAAPESLRTKAPFSTHWPPPPAETPAEAPGQASLEAVEPPEEKTPEDGSFEIVLSFTGDMLLASAHGRRAAGNFLDYAAKQEPGYFLQNVRPVFEADDFTVVNLENVLTDRNLTPREKDTDPAFWFRGGTGSTAILTAAGVEAVSLANNHTHDYGAAGYADTVRAVTDVGLQYGDNTHPL